MLMDILMDMYMLKDMYSLICLGLLGFAWFCLPLLERGKQK